MGNLYHLKKTIWFFFFLICASYIFPEGSKVTSSQKEVSPQETVSEMPKPKKSESLFLGDGGRGIVIAVPVPELKNSSDKDKWIAQFFQDNLTGDFVQFSAMTVVDRQHEKMIIAEQMLSETGFYSDKNITSVGNMTNAQCIVIGTIQNISGMYSVSFRINDISSNEIRASYSGRYSLADVESGKAPKETVYNLLKGLGIQLSSYGEELLMTSTQKKAFTSIKQVAKGIAAEKDNNVIEALFYFTQAAESHNAEASQHIQKFFGDIKTVSIHERAKFGLEQKQKWNKIFEDLQIYMYNNLVVIVYDFSTVKDSIDISLNTVTFDVSPGIKFVLNKNTLLVWRIILDQWYALEKNKEQSFWTKNVIAVKPFTTDYYLRYYVEVGLYDEYGDCIKTSYDIQFQPSFIYLKPFASEPFQIVEQVKFFLRETYKPLRFDSISLSEIVTDKITPKIKRVYYLTGDRLHATEQDISVPILSVNEWAEWLVQQGYNK